MISAFRRFCKLPAFERGMFVRGALLLPITTCALRMVRMKTIVHWLEAGGLERRHGRNPEKMRRLAASAVRMLEAASRYGMMRGTCLSKSLVLWHLLRREGLSPTLRIGGRKEGERLAAHAWIELDGKVIDDAGSQREDFVPFEDQTGGAWAGQR